jgi:regulator of replication initiation timing
MRGDILDNELFLQQFEEIEQKVERLIKTCQALEAANQKLKAESASLRETLERKADAERQYTEDKALIRSKIDSLMSRLDGFAELEKT